MNALDLLKEDHKKVKALLEELTTTTPRAAKRRGELLEKIAQEFQIHAAIEEEIFYPAFHQAAETRDDEKLFYEAFEEHRAVRELVLPDIQGTQTSADEFSGRAKVLKDLILHHAEEEEKQMFPRAKKLMKDQLEDLGSELETRKAELKKEYAADPSRSDRRRPRGGLEVHA
jgi:hemerythrin-like domain-containing protein